MAGKAQLVDDLWRSVDGLTKRRAAEVLDALLAAIREALARGEKVTVPGFGAFSAYQRPARTGRNPATGESIRVPESVSVRFRPPRNLLAPEGTRKGLGSGRGRRRPGSGGTGGGAGEPSLSRGGGREALGEMSLDATYGERSYLEPESEAVRGEGNLAASHRYHVVEVYYGTDRKAGRSRRPTQRYGAGRGTGLEYGVCEVSIPEDHRMGELEGPRWWHLELRRDPEEHVVLLSLREAASDAFFRELSSRVRQSARQEVLLFLHGFNVSFEDAARRTAQLAYDLKLEGAPVFYSWPSQGRLSLTGYTRDETNVEWTVPHLKAFLNDLATRSGARAIHLIAHSMGNRALTRALAEIAAAMAGSDAPAFSEVVLTAPDIDADVFRETAAAFRRAARRVTLYASGKDRALEASRQFHGYPRAGDGGADIVVVPGVETIDASAVDTDLIGHFYYGDNRSVLSDVYYLLRDGKSAGERFGLSERRSVAGRYWVFKT